MTGSPRAIGVAGLIAVLLNVIAVVALQPFTSPYSPADLPGWLASCVQYPLRTAVSSFTFTFGLVALAAFAFGFAAIHRSGLAVVAATFIGLGALLDAAGTVAPLVAINTEPAIGLAFLRLSLLLDATFNGCLGLGLLLVFFIQPGALRFVALASGLLSLPVFFQWNSPDAAKLLALAGPAWLAWITITSFGYLRAERP